MKLASPDNISHGETNSGANWPDARWNVSGLFIHDSTIQAFISECLHRYNCQPISAIHGSPPVRWNSGRIQKACIYQGSFASYIAKVLEQYARLGIHVLYTFSNSILRKRDLYDPTCNLMLEKLVDIQGKDGGVVLSSDLLSQYIRRRYPELRQISSIVKITMENGKGNLRYYRRLEKRYDRITVHPDDNLNQLLLSDLSREKAEILVNEPCVLNCKARKKHYMLYSNVSRELCFDLEALGGFEREKCKAVISSGRSDKAHSGGQSCTLSSAELKSIYALGFRYFKIQGRTKKLKVLRHNLRKYVLKGIGVE